MPWSVLSGQTKTLWELQIACILIYIILSFYFYFDLIMVLLLPLKCCLKLKNHRLVMAFEEYISWVFRSWDFASASNRKFGRQHPFSTWHRHKRKILAIKDWERSKMIHFWNVQFFLCLLGFLRLIKQPGMQKKSVVRGGVI